MLRIKDLYLTKVVPAMKEKFGYKSFMAVPRIEKVVVNTGFGRMVTGKSTEEQKKIYTSFVEDLAIICGQRPLLTQAKKSIAAFKTRQGMVIGAKVTLRGVRMYDFLERVIHVALPRSRDFRGLEPTALDKKGNLTIPIKEHIIFPEVSPEKTKSIFGFEVTVVTTAHTREEGLELFKLMGFPIKTIV